MGECFELDLSRLAEEGTMVSVQAMKWTLMALADHAHADGGSSRPSVPFIAWKTDLGVRTVQRALTQLEACGIIEAQGTRKGGGRGTPTEWKLHLDRAPRKEGFSNFANTPPTGLRESVIADSAMTCFFCGGTGDEELGPDGRAWHIDRLVPEKRGGHYIEGNVVLACAACNLSKGPRATPKPRAIVTRKPRHDDGASNLRPDIETELGVPVVADEPRTKPRAKQEPSALAAEGEQDTLMPVEEQRPRNVVWDALSELLGEPSTRQAMTARGRAVALLKAAGVDSARRVEELAVEYRRTFDGAALTQHALAKHADQLVHQIRQRKEEAHGAQDDLSRYTQA
jgi:5-methylcytosine-specific restriction endonuclease McrA